MKTKTVKEWLETLPDGYRELALAKNFGEFDNDPCGSLSAAVDIALDWGPSVHELLFWGGVYEWADSIGSCGEPAELPPLPNQFQTEEKNQTSASIFPEDAAERKTFPVGTFIKDYFPNAIAALAKHSYECQKQHGPATNGAPMEWLKDKSVGDGNEALRHFMEGDFEAMAWRSLELLERKLTK